MAKLTVKGVPYINPYEYHYDRLKNNPYFNDETWSHALKTNTIDMYIDLLSDNDKTSYIAEEYGYDYLDDDRKIYALYNEKYGDRHTIKHFSEKYIDENGVEQIKEYDSTEYDYTKKLLQEYRDIQIDELRAQEIDDAKRENWFLTGLNTVFVNPVLDLAEGIINTTQDFIAFHEAMIDAAAAMLKGESGKIDWDAVGESYINAFVDDDVTFGKDFSQWLASWESKYTFERNASGADTGWGKYFGGAVTSIGEMAPSIALSFIPYAGPAVSRITRYTSMWSRNVAETKEHSPSSSTMAILLNSSIRLGAEIAIEEALGKLFGRTSTDMLVYGSKTGGKAISKISTGNAIKRIISDAAQEGLEETLQDYSGYLINQFFAIADENFGTLSDWNLQTLVDSFVLGALSSIGMSTVHVLSTPRVDTGEVLTRKDGSIKIYKNGDDVKTKKLDKASSWLYKQTISEMMNSLSELAKDSKLTVSQRQQALGQLYVSYRTIGTVYKSIGQKRFDNALKMIERINNTPEMTAVDYENAAVKLINDAKSFGLLNTSKSLKSIKKELAERKLRNVTATVKKSDDASVMAKLPNDVQNNVRKTFEFNPDAEDIILTENGRGILVAPDKKTIVAPINAMSLDFDEITKMIAEAGINELINNDFEFKHVLKQLREIHKELGYEQDPVKTGVHVDVKVLYDILYNPDVFESILRRSNSECYKFLSKLDILLHSFKIKNKSDATVKNRLSEIKKSLKMPLIGYLIDQENAQFEHLTILTATEKKFIHNKRWNKNVYYRAMNDSLRDDDYKQLEAKVNSLSVEQTVKDDLLKKLHDDDEIESFFNDIKYHYNGVFNSLYDDETYFKETTAGKIRFNSFLKMKDLTLENLKSLPDENTNLGKYLQSQNINTLHDWLAYLQTEFDDFTNGAFSLTYKNAGLIATFDIVSNSYDDSEVVKFFNSNKKERYDDLAPRMDKNLRRDSLLFNKILKSDLPVVVKNYIEFDDILREPTRYLSDEILNDIENDAVNSNDLIAYLSKKLPTLTNGQIGITLETDGRPTLVNYQDVSALQTDVYNKYDNVATEFTKDEYKNGVPLSTFIKSKNLYGRGETAIVKFNKITAKYDRTVMGEYDPYRNVITINVDNNSNNDYVKFNIIHEYQHLIQHENNLAYGYTEIAHTKEIVDNVIENVPALFDNDSKLVKKAYHVNEIKNGQIVTTKSVNNLTASDMKQDLLTAYRKGDKLAEYAVNKIVSFFIYRMTSGELDAYGNKIKTLYPIAIETVRDGVDIIVFPWGDRFQTQYDDETNELMSTKLNDTVKYITQSGPVHVSRAESSKFDKFDSEITESQRRKQEILDKRVATLRANRLANRTPIYKRKQGKGTRRIAQKTAKAHPILNNYVDAELFDGFKEFLIELEELPAESRGILGSEFYQRGLDGTLTKFDVEKAIRDINTSDKLNDDVFKIINRTFYRNPNITSISQLNRLSKNLNNFSAVAKVLAKRTEIEGDETYSDWLFVPSTIKGLESLSESIKNNKEYPIEFIDENGHIKNGAKTWGEIYNDYLQKSYYGRYYKENAAGVVDGENLNIDDSNLNVILLETYDGTLASMVHAYNKARFVAMYNYKVAGGRANASLDAPVGDDSSLEDFISSDASLDDIINADFNTKVLKIKQYYAFTLKEKNPNIDIKRLKAAAEKKWLEIDENWSEKRVNDVYEKVKIWSLGKMKKKLNLNAKSDAYLQRIRQKQRKTILTKRTEIIKLINHPSIKLPFKKHFVEDNKSLFEFAADGKTVMFKESLLYERVKRKKQVNFEDENAPENFKQAPLNLRKDQYGVINDKLAEAKRRLKSDLYAHTNWKNRITQFERTIGKQQKEINKLNKLNKKIVANGYTKSTFNMVFDNTNFTVNIEPNDQISSVPSIVRKMMSLSYDYYANSEVKYIIDDNNSKNVITNAEQFLSVNVDTFKSLSTTEIRDIINFYKYANIDTTNTGVNVVRRFNAFRMFTLAYIGNLALKNKIENATEIREEINELLSNRVRLAATELSNWKSVMERLNPAKAFARELSKRSGLDFTEDELSGLTTAVQNATFFDKNSLNAIKDEFDKLIEIGRAKHKEKPAHFLDKMVKFQQLMLLSNPGTWGRNHTSDAAILALDKASEFLGFAFTKKLKKRGIENGQYKIANVKVSDDIKSFVKTKYIESGFLSLINDGLTKLDTNKINNKKISSTTVVTDLIRKKVESVLYNDNYFDSKMIKPSKFKRLNRFAGKPGGLDMLSKIIYKAMADDPYITHRCVYYLERMIAERNASSDTELHLDLNQPDAKLALELVGDAYGFAIWDFMHRSNFITAIEKTIREKTGVVGYFFWKQALPFAAAAHNWFMAGLDYTPIGLGVAIRNLCKLESVIAKMDEKYEAGLRKGESKVSSKFAQYMETRRLGKGVIGTTVFFIGVLLTAFGFLDVDDKDDKTKLRIVGTDAWLDVSDLFGTQSLFLGASVVRGIEMLYKKEGNVWNLLYDVSDNIFADSLLEDVFNLFRYEGSIGEYAITQITDGLSLFLPNVLKTVSSLIQSAGNFEIKYTGAWYDVFLKWLNNYFPSAAFWSGSGKRVDPYTGEIQSKYNLPFLYELINQLSPIKINAYAVSDLEKEAIVLGVRKGELTGRYEDIGKLNSANVEKLNAYYGQLNERQLQRLYKNVDSYKVWDEKKNKYVTIKYSKMSDKQKKSVIERIMNDNASTAKIYICTELGYKYYADDNEYTKLRQLGIKNVFKATNKKKGFVK